jgi:hypothetical protein
MNLSKLATTTDLKQKIQSQIDQKAAQKATVLAQTTAKVD